MPKASGMRPPGTRVLTSNCSHHSLHIMNNAASNLVVFLSDPHMRYPVIILVLLEVLKVWFPNFSQNIDSTEKLIALYLASVAYKGQPSAPADKPAPAVPPSTP